MPSNPYLAELVISTVFCFSEAIIVLLLVCLCDSSSLDSTGFVWVRYGYIIIFLWDYSKQLIVFLLTKFMLNHVVLD